jgi:serine/threonine-protein kinase
MNRLLPQLAKYEILEELGHGGMATVYRARDVRLGREVAVKIIHKHLRENREMAARFEAEARTVAKLRHPNIVEVYDVSSEDEPDKYIVVQLSRGMTLRRLLGRVGRCRRDRGALGVELGRRSARACGGRHPPRSEARKMSSRPRRGEGAAHRLRYRQDPRRPGVTSTGQVLGLRPTWRRSRSREARSTRGRRLGLGVCSRVHGRHLPSRGNPAQVLRRVLEGRAPLIASALGGALAKMPPRPRRKSPTALRRRGADPRDAAELESLGFTDAAELRPSRIRMRTGRITQRLAADTPGEQASKAGIRTGRSTSIARLRAARPTLSFGSSVVFSGSGDPSRAGRSWLGRGGSAAFADLAAAGLDRP